MIAKLKFPLILLAGGKSSRLGTPKGLFPFQGRPWLEEQLSRFIKAGGKKVILVLGYHTEEYFDELRWMRLPKCLFQSLPIEILINPNPERGQFSSLQTGLLKGKKENAIFLSPIDVPLPTPQDFQQIEKTFAQTPSTIVANFNERSAHPVLIKKDFGTHLLTLGPTERLDTQLSLWAHKNTCPIQSQETRLNLNYSKDFQALEDRSAEQRVSLSDTMTKKK